MSILDTINEIANARAKLREFDAMVIDEFTPYKDLIFEMFEQACRLPNGLYDHRYMSTYELAQGKLIEWGMVHPDDCLYQNERATRRQP